MNKMPRIVVAALVLGGLVSACGGPLVLSLIGNEDMNEGNAVTVVYYQLSSDAGFLNTPAESFWSDDVAALGSDLVGAQKRVVLYPGQSQEMEIKPLKGAMYIGFAANFRNPDPQAWRIIHSVKEIKGKRVTITVARDRLITYVQ